MMCMRLIKQLVKHKWGCKNFFQNQKAIKYALDRGSHKQSAVPITKDASSAKATIKTVIEKKYSLVHQVLHESPFPLLEAQPNQILDPVIETQLQTYHANGVWGIGGPGQDAPEVKML